MARTKTAPDTTPTPVQAPPDTPTQEVARPSPVLAWPSEWPVPELPDPAPRRRARGLPMAPVLAAAGNGSTLAATAAYSAGGPAAAAATGVVMAAGATAAVLRRRATVRRGMAARPGGGARPVVSRSGGGSAGRSGGSAGSGRGGSGPRRSSATGRSGVGSGGRSALRRSGATSAGSPVRSGSGGGRRSGLGSGSRHGLLARGKGRHAGASGGSGLTPKQERRHRKAVDKAARQAAKQARKQTARDLAAKPGSGKRATLRAATARAARKTWAAARPHLNRARTTTARAGRRTARTLWDATRAGLVGIATVLWQRKLRVFRPAVRAMWRRIKAQRAAAQAATDPAPAVADSVRRPTHTQPAATSPGGTMSGGHHFVAAATEMARAAAAYQPTGMLQVGQDFTGLEEALRIHAEALKTTVENADANWPLHPNIVELMRQIHGLQLKAAELAQELKPAFQQLHDVDIARLENPRQGERMWDVSANL